MRVNPFSFMFCGELAELLCREGHVMINEAGSMSKAAVAAPEGAVDWRVLDELKVLQKPGAPDLRLRLMTMFLKSSPPLMEGIRTAVLTSDAQLLTMSAHTLKSTALSLGAMRLGAI